MKAGFGSSLPNEIISAAAVRLVCPMATTLAPRVPWGRERGLPKLANAAGCTHATQLLERDFFAVRTVVQDS